MADFELVLATERMLHDQTKAQLRDYAELIGHLQKRIEQLEAEPSDGAVNAAIEASWNVGHWREAKVNMRAALKAAREHKDD